MRKIIILIAIEKICQTQLRNTQYQKVECLGKNNLRVKRKIKMVNLKLCQKVSILSKINLVLFL
ncbi:unnamed protein product [Paramecium sonneborni]|uniref:Uncharacterized protein n=1 Tax=Paramecium sonneborni TaxID=65129 RepID=A0A8S1PG61_9CILI|nr:unnamed protein product [Paramecium sonneborni]